MENIISVVILTYNQQDTIGRAIDSVLMQKCHVPFEIIIGEDASTDNTRVICQEYAKKHPDIIRLFCNEQNKGITDNYFDCLLQCRGQYIADCAGDDFWIDPDKLEKEVSVMESHPNVTMVITNWQYYDEQTQQTTPSRQQQHAPITPGRDLLRAIITQQNMSVFHLCTSLYRSDIFRKAYEEDTYMFRNKDLCSEDMQIASAMAWYGDIAYLPDVTLNYSISDRSVSNVTDSEKAFRFVSRTIELTNYLANKYHIDIQDFLSHRLFELGMHAFRSHQTALYQETLAYEQKWQVKRSFKNHCLFTVMRYDALWRTGLILHRIFIWLK